MRLTRSQALVGMASVGLTLAGCQTYERDPLNLDEHRRAWLDRSPTSEPVVEFARRLGEHTSGPAPDVYDPADGITLQEGEVIALVFNPGLRVARARGRVAAATAENAGLWEDPVFQLDVLRITESVSDPWVVTTGFALTIPLSGRLDAEKDRADAAWRGELERIAQSEWDVRHELRRAWASWSAAKLRLTETEALVIRLRSLVDSTTQLAETGELLRTESALFTIEQVQRRNELRRLRGQIAEEEQRIRSLLGLAPDAVVELIAAMPTGLGAEQDDARVAERNLTLARLQEEYEVAEQSLRREILKQYPDLTIGPLYESDQGQSRIGFLGAIPLPIFNANRQGIAEAKAGRVLARSIYETEYERIMGELASTRARLESIRSQREDLERAVIPLIDRQLADAEQLLQLGEGGALVLLESLTRAHESRLQLIDLRLGESLAAADIMRLLGPEPASTEPDEFRDQEVSP